MRSVCAHLLAISLPLLACRALQQQQQHHSGVSACETCGVSLYQNTGFGTRACTLADFGCYPGEATMWIRPPCGGVFHCDDTDLAAVRCGSRYFRPEPGQERLNCTCVRKRRLTGAAVLLAGQGQAVQKKRRCGARTAIDSMGGVSDAYRRLPQPAGADPSVKCCRNKPTSRGGIDWENATLNFTRPNFAARPSTCEALCDRHPSGRCRFFSHSVRWKNCLLCARCVPEIMLGDDTFASFERATEDPSILFTGHVV